MPIIAKDPSTRPPLPQPNMYQAVCFDVWDIGIQKKTHKNITKAMPRVILGWELSERINADGPYNGRRYTMYKEYNNSLHAKADLGKDLKSWLGRPLTDADRQGLDLESLIGTNCFLNIVHNESKGTTYANISTINPLAKGMTPIEPESRRSIPEWITNKLASAITLEEAAQINLIAKEAAKAKSDGDEENEIPF